MRLWQIISTEGIHQELSQEELAQKVIAELREEFGIAEQPAWFKVIAEKRATLYDSNGKSGDLFKSIVEELFPWDEEPSNNVPPIEAAGIIYDVFRNPLTHAGGLFVDWRGDQRFLVQKPYAVEVTRQQTQNKTTGHTEEWIEALEMASSRPDMVPTLKVEGAKKVLLVEGLYWCVRRMIQKLTDDTKRMANAEKMLSAYK